MIFMFIDSYVVWLFLKSAHEGLLDLANKNTGGPVQFEFPINNTYFFNIRMSYITSGEN